MDERRKNIKEQVISQVTISGVTVTLIFAAEKNREVACVVRDILKGSYLRQKSA